MGDCIPVRPWDSPIECLAEIRMIWKDKNEKSLLISLRLYFLPENTPQGRNCHGEVSILWKLIKLGDERAQRERECWCFSYAKRATTTTMKAKAHRR